jgi:lactate dehydrogenase-like 2-hydroxyacid dehydrogenase|tara:strand:+ start:407 stop:1378 length:972 start_codon:yes stop_codon:yes gene_type:complete
MAKPKVVVTRRWPKAVEKKVSELFNAKLNKNDRPMTDQQLKHALKTADALMPTVTDKITKQILDAAPKQAKIIGNFGVGFNNIDIEAAKENNLVVTNTPDVLTECTSDIGMILMLSAARRTSEGERHLRNKKWIGWRPTHMMGTKVTGKTLGVVGMGRIGQAMAKKSHYGFGMNIIFYDPYLANKSITKKMKAKEAKSIKSLLSKSDFVSLHCPAIPETRHLMNKKTFKQMKPSAFLVNTSRGDVVNEKDLIVALKKGLIAGAGLDVYEAEPKVPQELLKMDNVVLLPHLGSASLETREAMGFRVVENVKAFFNGKRPRDRVA